MNDNDLADRLDHSFGHGPDHPPIDRHVVAGRRAVRRRRAGVASGAMALALVIGGTALATTADAGTDAADDVPAAASPTPTPNPTPTPSPTPNPVVVADSGQLLPEMRAGLTIDGDFLIRPGTEVVSRIWDPLSTPPGSHTDSLAQRADGEVHYYLQYYEDSENGSRCGTVAVQSPRFPTLESWLDHEQALLDASATPPAVLCDGSAGLPRVDRGR